MGCQKCKEKKLRQRHLYNTISRHDKKYEWIILGIVVLAIYGVAMLFKAII